MITLYTFGPNFDLPDPSPFVMKAELLLKLAKLDYQVNAEGDLTKAPKGKFPYIQDNGVTVADSTLIRYYLAEKYDIDFESEVNAKRKPPLFFAEKHCEDNLYFLIMANRWLEPENYQKGPKLFFEKVPSVIRWFISNKVKSDIRKTLHLQGLGRHSKEDQVRLVRRSASMLADLLGAQSYFGGETPCGYDAGIFPFIAGVLTPYFDCPFRPEFESQKSLVSYRDRMMQRFYPDFFKGN